MYIYIYACCRERETCHLSLHAVPSADIGRYFQDLHVVSQLQGSNWSNITRNWMQWGWSLSLYNLYFVLFSFQMFSSYIYIVLYSVYIYIANFVFPYSCAISGHLRGAQLIQCDFSIVGAVQQSKDHPRGSEVPGRLHGLVGDWWLAGSSCGEQVGTKTKIY